VKRKEGLGESSEGAGGKNKTSPGSHRRRKGEFEILQMMDPSVPMQNFLKKRGRKEKEKWGAYNITSVGIAFAKF